MARYNGSKIMAFDDVKIGLFGGEANNPVEAIIVAPYLIYPSYGRGTRRSFKVYLDMRDGIFIRNYLNAVFQCVEQDAVGDSEDVEEFKKMARIHRNECKSYTFIATIKHRALQLPSTAIRRNFIRSSLWPPEENAMKFTNWNEKIKLTDNDKDAPILEQGLVVLHIIPEDKVDEW